MSPTYQLVEKPEYACIDAPMLAQWLEIPSEDAKALDLLAQCAETGISMVEEYCRISTSPRRMSVFFHELTGTRPLKYGPVSNTNLAMTTGGFAGVSTVNTVPTRDQVFGFPRAMIRGSYRNSVTLTYDCGYTAEDLPPALRTAVLIASAELYCNQTGYKPSGDLPRNWRTLANPFRDIR